MPCSRHWGPARDFNTGHVTTNSFAKRSRHSTASNYTPLMRLRAIKEHTETCRQPALLDVEQPWKCLCRSVLLPIVVVTAATLLPSTVAHAAEIAPEGFLEFILRTVESLGPMGPFGFIVAVAICECIPLFPTQPLSLASGLLFGAQTGTVCMLIGTTAAALLAFTIARGVGRPLAERIIKSEMKEGEEGSSSGGVKAKLQAAQVVIEQGSFWQQTGAVCVLRLTPFIPFSASNYMLGLSPLPLTPYVLGTVSGMAVWSAIYASVGGASRVLLRRGADPEALLADMMHRMSSMTESAGSVAAAVGLAAVVVYAGMTMHHRSTRTE